MRMAKKNTKKQLIPTKALKKKIIKKASPASSPAEEDNTPIKSDQPSPLEIAASICDIKPILRVKKTSTTTATKEQPKKQSPSTSAAAKKRVVFSLENNQTQLFHKLKTVVTEIIPSQKTHNKPKVEESINNKEEEQEEVETNEVEMKVTPTQTEVAEEKEEKKEQQPSKKTKKQPQKEKKEEVKEDVDMNDVNETSTTTTTTTLKEEEKVVETNDNKKINARQLKQQQQQQSKQKQTEQQSKQKQKQEQEQEQEKEEQKSKDNVKSNIINIHNHTNLQNVTISGFNILAVQIHDSQYQQYIYYRKETNKKYPVGRTMFTLNLPSQCKDIESIQQFFQTPDIEQVLFSNETAIEPIPNAAHIILKDSDSLTALFKDLLKIKLSTQKVLNAEQELKDLYHSQTVTDYDQLQEQLDTYMMEFDKERLLKSREAKLNKGAKDEDGFVLVTGKKSSYSLPSLEEIREREEKKKSKNFYLFQQRQQKKKELDDLRKKFEQDKLKIAKMSANRKFKPY